MFVESSAELLEKAIPIYFIKNEKELEGILDDYEHKQYTVIKENNKTNRVFLLFDQASTLIKVIYLASDNPFDSALLARKLPANIYYFTGDVDNSFLSYLGLALGQYRFTAHKEKPHEALGQIKVIVPKEIDIKELVTLNDSVKLARDLINQPTNLKGTSLVCDVARDFAERYNGECKIIEGEALEKGFPLVYAVGKGSSDNPPRLVDFTWNEGKKLVKIALVGKGVCFDSGGLGIKPAKSMELMKKDMGGAANVLALTQMILNSNLPIELKVIIPSVENAISGTSFRPGDVYKARDGQTVEIGHTDAEGRLILADALVYAQEWEPEIIIDMATLTGAARVALGPNIPPFFSNDDNLASEIMNYSTLEKDPMWRLPLFEKYKDYLKSKLADINNISSNGFAGSIVAALFLQNFIKKDVKWLHFDIYGWNPTEQPFSPVGGEAQCIRAIYKFIKANIAKLK